MVVRESKSSNYNQRLYGRQVSIPEKKGDKEILKKVKQWSKSFEFKVEIGIFIGLFILFSNFLITQKIISNSASLAFVINVAGKQAALIEKYNRDLFLYLKTSDLEEISKTITLFEHNMNVLIKGGKLYSDFEMKNYLEIKEEDSEIILKGLTNVNECWLTMKNLAKEMIVADKNDNENYRKIIALNNQLLEKIYQVISLYQKRADAKLGQIKTIQTLLIIISIIIFIAAILYLRINVINSIEKIIINLSQAFNEVKRTYVEIVEIGKKIRSSSENQFRAASSTVSTMDVMTQMIETTNEFVSESSRKTSDVKMQIKGEGNTILEEMRRSIEIIKKSNADFQQIINIINTISAQTTTINEIVSKTKMLSFNATIEAARAGIHGRGFTVVSNEVGNLATQSGRSAQHILEILESGQVQIKHLIVETSQMITNMVQVVGQASLIFEGIFDKIEEVDGKIFNITTAAKEQKNGINKTLAAMKELDGTVQANNQLSISAMNSLQNLNLSAQKLEKSMNSLNEVIFGTTYSA